MKPLGLHGLGYWLDNDVVECACCGSIMEREECPCNNGETWPGELFRMDPMYGENETGVCSNCNGEGANYICVDPDCRVTYASKIARKECNV